MKLRDESLKLQVVFLFFLSGVKPESRLFMIIPDTLKVMILMNL